MTDKEKARELAITYFADTDEQGKLVYDTRCEAACLEMAQWQKEQIINKTCEWLSKSFRNDKYWGVDDEGDYIVNEWLIEDLIKELKEEEI